MARYNGLFIFSKFSRALAHCLKSLLRQIGMLKKLSQENQQLGGGDKGWKLVEMSELNSYLGLCLGLINLCVLFLDAQSAPNKGSVDAQNNTYAHNVCPRQ
jgi:hypothetical protein